MNVKYDDVTITLIGQDRNAFNLIGLTNRAISKQHGSAAGKEFVTEAMSCDSYDALLILIQRTVHVV